MCVYKHITICIYVCMCVYMYIYIYICIDINEHIIFRPRVFVLMNELAICSPFLRPREPEVKRAAPDGHQRVLLLTPTCSYVHYQG